MKFHEFQSAISTERMSRYLTAMNANTKKSMTLYRLNLKLSQEFYTVISCLEVTLRNAIDRKYKDSHGPDWLRDSAEPGGFFQNPRCGKTPQIIQSGMNRLSVYSHSKLIAEMDFGFWRWCFSKHQYRLGGAILLQIFPNRPQSTPIQQYNNTYVFSKLERINMLRNRLAHHEPICFMAGNNAKNTQYARDHYSDIVEMFTWLDIDHKALLYGLDHILKVAD